MSDHLSGDVYGYLPYWEMSSAIVDYLDWNALSVLSLFSVTWTGTGTIDRALGGYKAMVIKALGEKANVDVWPHPMFQSEKLNQALVKNLKHGPYDVVHVNLGLHGVAEGRIKPGTYEPLTRQFIQIIRDTMPKAKIIWANTTQFTLKGKPTELDPVKNPTVLEHNRMAAKLMGMWPMAPFCILTSA